MTSIRYVGLDVHAETIAVAVAEPGRTGEVRSVGTIPNRLEAIRKVVKKLGGPGKLRVCYEAGPCGYALYWQLTELGVSCEVVAPTLIPRKPGDRVKTDRRDAEKLARSYRSGDLTAVWVPDRAHEALRDLVRARAAAKRDRRRAVQRLSKFLLRQGRRPATKMKQGTAAYLAWATRCEFEYEAHREVLTDYVHEVEHATARGIRLDQAIDDAIAQAPAAMRDVIAALQALRGVAKLTAVTLTCEVGQLSRFEHPSQLMAYAGIVPSEHTSGACRRQGGITKTGNRHLRTAVVESGWAYRHRPAIGVTLKKRQQGLDREVVAIAWKAQQRLTRRYRALLARGKPSSKAVTAIARELLGFIWAIGVAVERKAA